MLFTFPSRYWFTIGLWGVFSLSGWSRQFHTGFLVSRATQDTARNNKLTCTGLSPSAGALSNALPIRLILSRRSPTTPIMHYYIMGLGFCAFARHYSRNHFCFLLLRVMRCFSSPRSPSTFVEWHSFTVPGCPIRISTDQGLFAPTRSFSQLITSFFASQSLGIHRSLLFAFLFYYRINTVSIKSNDKSLYH